VQQEPTAPPLLETVASPGQSADNFPNARLHCHPARCILEIEISILFYERGIDVAVVMYSRSELSCTLLKEIY
jgi:hypothetical protein